MPTVDVHQHLWPEALVEALAKRTEPPRLNGSRLEVAGEKAVEIDLATHSLDERLSLLDRCEIEVAVISLPPSLGIGVLDESERSELVDAYERGVLELVDASAGRLAALAAGAGLDDRFVGACIGAPDFLDLEASAPLLYRLEQRGSFLFVHPGAADSPAARPAWWPAVVQYTAQMQAAYAGWLAQGVQRWPSLKVVFAILAGGGPFQLERLQSRGVPGREIMHDNVFFETASYGRRALELCLATFGVGQLLYGSDAPVIDPLPTLEAVRGFGDAVAEALCEQNPSRLLI